MQAEEALKGYTYPAPFASHLKSYFQAHKNMGGRDRRELKELLYSYFRIARALPKKLSTGEKLSAAYAYFHPDKSESASIPEIDPGNLFPSESEISLEINKEAFIRSHLTQPLTWIHVRNAYRDRVEKELEEKSISPVRKENAAYGFEPETRLTELQGFRQGWFWIQDASSQKTAEFFNAKDGDTWWDACAGAGGKSLCFRELNPGVNLHASDIRPAILENLQERHKTVFGKKVQTFTADITRPVKTPVAYDGIIVDAPCTGSGTWARNPEHLLYFHPAAIADFVKKQSAILENAWPHLKPGGALIYITCSVFHAENEDMIDAFAAKHQPLIETKRYIHGYGERAETMFLCRMVKPKTAHA